MTAFGMQAGAGFTSLYSFTGANDGGIPYAGLVPGADGYLYGTTSSGGTNRSGSGVEYGGGTAFKIGTNGALTPLCYFNAAAGLTCTAGLAQGSDGNLYGTTVFNANPQEDDFAGDGTVFQISTNGGLTNLCYFNQPRGFPLAGLMQGHDGDFYGTTSAINLTGNQSRSSYGDVFKVGTNGDYTSLYFFGTLRDAYGDALDGGNPRATLIQGNDGNLYGTTWTGGDSYSDADEYYTYGTVFKISTNGALTSLYSFGGIDGTYPVAGLVQGSDGNLYGTTSGGGTYSADFYGNFYTYGTVFKISTNGAFTSLYSFTGTNDGANPEASLVQGSDGNLYGTTAVGGTNDSGTVFEINPDGTGFTTIYTFSAINAELNNFTYASNSDGAFPRANLILLGNTLYGTTSAGGIYGFGTVFSLTLPGPQLNIMPSGASVVLSWPTNFVLTLESTLNLGPAAVWNSVSPAPVIVNGQNVVTNPMTNLQMFYRLK